MSRRCSGRSIGRFGWRHRSLPGATGDRERWPPGCSWRTAERTGAASRSIATSFGRPCQTMGGGSRPGCGLHRLAVTGAGRSGHCPSCQSVTSPGLGLVSRHRNACAATFVRGDAVSGAPNRRVVSIWQRPSPRTRLKAGLAKVRQEAQRKRGGGPWRPGVAGPVWRLGLTARAGGSVPRVRLRRDRRRDPPRAPGCCPRNR